MSKKGLLIGLVIIASLQSFAQKKNIADSIQQIPAKYLEKVASKSSAIEEQLDKKSQKVLDNLQKQEAKIMKKLSKIDSIASKNIFAGAVEQYKQLQEKLKNPSFKNYFPSLDTLATSLKFLEQNKELISNIKEGKEKLDDALAKVKGLQSQVQKAEEIKQFLKERREYLKEQLSKFGFVKELKQINKQVYYYAVQIKEYKEILNDPKKIERKTIELLSKTKPFKDFMAKNSFLSSMFPMPSNNTGNGQQGFASLQTRQQISNFLQQTGASGSNTASQFQQSIRGAMDYATPLRQKLSALTGGNSADLEMPDFKPNNQKTKSFFKRLDLGINIQSQGTKNFLPATSDLGVSIGYKLNDKSIIGIGASYKIGWGKGWDSLNITHQGVGLRTYIDWKIKKQLSISGGYEQNYRSEFSRIEQLRNLSAWQRSGLIGITRSFSLKSKIVKTSKIQLLWDFLSYYQRPRPQSIIFRVGYNF